MNKIISQIMNHRSVRSFDPNATLPKDHLTEIISAGQQASTSCSGQFYSVIEISKEKRDIIFEFCGKQQFVKQASFFGIICLDVHRLRRIVELSGGENQDWELASVLIGVFDAGLMAQNMVLAAESLGYDICFCGSCGDSPSKIIKELKLPNQVMPLTGLAIGKGIEDPPVRPRLPMSMIHHVDEYQDPEDKDLIQAIDQVGNKLSEEGYYQKYSGKEDDFTWKDHMATKFGGKWLNAVEKRRKKALEGQGFL